MPAKAAKSAEKPSRKPRLEEEPELDLLSPNGLGAKSNGTASESQAATDKTPSRKTSRSGRPAGESSQKKAPAVEVPESAADHPLLDMLINGSPIGTIVDDIVALYQRDSSTAIAVLITTICRASGAPSTAAVEGNAIGDKSNIMAVLDEVFARIPSDATAYLVINKDPKYRRFKKSFPEFFEQLIIAMENHDLLSDGVFLDLVANWLTVMAESKARSFRHTTTIAVAGILTGFTKRIHEADEAVKMARKKDAKAAEKKLERLNQNFEDIFTHGLHPRLKDIAPEIRLSCFSALRVWMTAYPDLFLNNRLLRYFVIALHDKKAEIRAEALETIVQLLSADVQHINRLRELLRHFAERVTEMACDIDARVADLAVKVTTLIIRADHEVQSGDHSSATFPPELIDNVLLSVTDDRAAIRQSAGTLLKVFIRCRSAVDGKNDYELTGSRAELLVGFISALRNEFGEPLAEKYVIDAVWTEPSPPQLLTDYKPFTSLAKVAQESSLCEISLRVLAALMERLSGALNLGPIARDDLKTESKKSKEENTENAELRKKISQELATFLNETLEKFVGDNGVVEAVCDVLCAMDLSVFNAPRLIPRFEDVITAIRKATLTTAVKPTLMKLTKAWRVLAFSEYEQKQVAELGLQEVLKQALKQLSHQEKYNKSRRSQHTVDSDSSQHDAEAIQVWQRVAAVASLVSLTDQLGLFTSSLTHHVLAKSSPPLLAPMLDACYCTALWKVGAAQNDPSIRADELSSSIADLIRQYLQVCEFDSETSSDVLQLRAQSFVLLCDLAALPQGTLTQAQQQSVVQVLGDIFDGFNDVIRQLHDRLKKCIKLQGTGNLSARSKATVRVRKAVSEWEALATTMAMGISRLFTFQRLSDTLAPQALLQWTKSTAKIPADIFKGLFYTMRERLSGGTDSSHAGGSWTLEKTMLLAGLRQCAELGFTAPALELYFQLGSKLSSLHFVPNDRHYADVVYIIRWGIEYASTTDPTVLHAVTPFCPRLKQADALSIAGSLTKNEFFSTVSADNTSGADIYARAFVSGIRRAAKLEEARPNTKLGTGVTPGSAGGSRSAAKASHTRSLRPIAQEDGLLAGIIGSGSKFSSVTKASPAGRTVMNDGWRTRTSEPPQAVTPAQIRQSAPRLTPGGRSNLNTQASAAESGISTLLQDIEGETFIATQEWA